MAKLKKRIKTTTLIRKVKNKEATKYEKLILLKRIFAEWGLLLKGSLVILVLLIVIVIIAGGEGGSDDLTAGFVSRQAFPDSVLRWEPYVRAEAELNDIPHAADYLLVIIMLETRGEYERWPDIMQSSESLGLPPNTITCPFESIAQGVFYFASGYKQFPDHDLLNILQSYNFGHGFLFYTDPAYDFDVAVSFSRQQSNGVRVTYTNPLAVSINGGWRYNFGNMFYAKLAREFLVASHDGEWTIPVRPGFVITSPFGRRLHPITGVFHHHNGIDFVNPGVADAPIFAAADGEVVFSGWAGGYGNHIIIQHDATTFSAYAHNRVNLVRKGDEVEMGDVIAVMGTTGNSTGVHLHFEISLNSTTGWYGQVDPAPIIGLE